ncbi:MAG: hypothetical protein QM831_43245 [Kofleriaceae bacterium]
MARSIDQQLAALKQDPTPAALIAALEVKKVSSAVVLTAAKLIAAHGVREAVPALVATFAQMCEPKRDPGCLAKIATATALFELDLWAPEVFEVGVRVVQIEGLVRPGEPPPDVAGQLRGICAQAYVAQYRPDALDVCAEVLADVQIAARAGAATALGNSRRPEAMPVLIYKVSVGSDDPDVLAPCFEALFAIDRDRAAPIALRLLYAADEARSNAAALALGGARNTDALVPLVEYAREHGEVGTLALALLRTDAANKILVDMIKAGSEHAYAALATFESDPAVAALLALARRVK